MAETITKARMMFYDIPQGSGMDNPSPEFRQFSFRINLSCWVIAEDDLLRAMHTLDEITRVGGNWHTLRIDREDMDNAIGLCAKFIDDELAENFRSAEFSTGRYEARIEEMDDRDAAIRLYRTRTGGIVRRLNLVVRDMRRLATRWGVATMNTRLAHSLTGVTNLQTRMYQQAAMYVRATSELAAQVGNRDAMVQAALHGRVPGAILADYLQDHASSENNNEATANQLRDAFE